MNKTKSFLAIVVVIATVVSCLQAVAQWSAAVNISPQAMAAGLDENANQCMAVSGDTIHAVWSDHRTNGYAIYYRHSVDTGLTWNTAVAITDTAGKASMPSIAVWGATVHVVWMDTLLGIRASYYKRSLDGGNTWGNKVLLDSNTAFWPGVAAYGSLVVITLNKQPTSTNSEVYIMRSLDNGATWGSEFQISNAAGRSEDPAIAIQGTYIHLVWNDNRGGGNVMKTYYRRSADSGATWGPETDLIDGGVFSYTPMICLNNSHADVANSDRRTGSFQIRIKQSADMGTTWTADTQVTIGADTNGLYPYLVRDDSQLHMVYSRFGTGGGPRYIHSADGGATWIPSVSLGTGGQPFIAYTGCVLHVIFLNNGRIYYERNATGNTGGHCTFALNLKLYIQGYYITGGTMEKVLYNEAVETNSASTNVDTVTVELHNATSPFASVASFKGVLQTNGNMACAFPYSLVGSSYYIAVKHRNAVQTWSAAPVMMSATTNYDFTTAASKAYGNNLIQMETGKWAIYSADINQDENVDLADFPSLDLGINQGLYGYFTTDINGDGNVDLIDFPILDSNIAGGIFSQHP